jgi:hypothetical protein
MEAHVEECCHLGHCSAMMLLHVVVVRRLDLLGCLELDCVETTVLECQIVNSAVADVMERTFLPIMDDVRVLWCSFVVVFGGGYRGRKLRSLRSGYEKKGSSRVASDFCKFASKRVKWLHFELSPFRKGGFELCQLLEEH